MNILAIIRLGLQVVAALAKWAGDRQLIQAGEAQAVAMGTAATLENIDAARKAKDAMASGSDPAWRDRVRNKHQVDQ